MNADHEHPPWCRFIFPGLITACCILLIACNPSPKTSAVSFPRYDAKIEFTGIDLKEQAPVWVDNKTIAYLRADNFLVIHRLDSGALREIREVDFPPCATVNGTVRALFRATPGDRFSLKAIEIEDKDIRIIDAYVEGERSLTLSVFGCHLQPRKFVKPRAMTMHIREDGYLFAETNEGGASIRTNIYGSGDVPRLSEDLLYYHGVLQFLPWRNAYFLQTHAWKGYLQLYLIDRDDWSVHIIDQPAIEIPPNQEFIFTQAGLVYVPQLFRRGLADPKLAGLYWVNPDNGKLKEIIEGQMALPTVSPDGCRIAVPYRDGSKGGSNKPPELVLVNVCKTV